MNNSPWPPELRAKFGDAMLSVVTQIKQATSLDEFALIVQPFGLTEDEYAQVLKLMPSSGSPTMARQFRMSRAKFYAAAWLVGAAYRRIGRVLGISHQTVHNAASRILGLNPVRISSGPLSDEQVEALYTEFQKYSYLDVIPLTEQFLKLLNEWDRG